MASDWSAASLLFCGVLDFATAAVQTRRIARSRYSQRFTDFLHKRLKDAGIEVFKDHKKFRAGEEINQGLKDVIKLSRISIAIFSKDYASSESCLMELAHQVGHFATSFAKHEVDDKVDPNTIKIWREALQQVCGLCGLERKKINGGHVSDLLEKVLTSVMEVLKKDDQDVTDKLVGIDPHVQEMMTKLGVVYSHGQAIAIRGEDVRVVGICGMEGVGKTTLAKVVFNQIYKLFDGCSFLEGIDLGEVKLSQEMLIADLLKENRPPLRFSEGIKIIRSRFSNMKVLIVLDNMREAEQIEALVGKLHWFGSGTRIIVTTSRKNVFDGFNDQAARQAVKEHEVQPMRYPDALQLFRKHAFQGDSALQDVSEYDSLSINIVKALGGHPLAIVLRAQYLRHNRENIEIWRETEELLEKNAGDRVEEKVEAALMASYKSLDDPTKNIFLDIACSFIGQDWRIARYMWKGCGYAPAIQLNRLCKMCMLEIGENNELRMPALLRDFGRKLHERRRIWNQRDAISIQEDGKGKERDLKKLVILDLSWSTLTGDSQLWRQIMEKAEGLKVLNLQGCVWLPALLNFEAPINLERLILEHCTQLARIGPFISNLKKLRSLNLRKCRGVKQLPQELGCMEYLEELLIDGTGIRSICFPKGSLESLKILSACDCEELKDISTIGRLRNLTSLALDNSANIDWDPETFEFPRKLQRLSLRNCRKFNELPQSVGELTQLEVMDLSGTGIKEMPPSVKNLRNLKMLNMECTHLENFPEEIVKLEKLEEINFSRCRSLVAQDRCDISGLSSLRILKLSSSNVAGLPQGICELPHLQTLDLLKCKRLQALPEFPSSLLCLLWGSKNLTVPDLSYLTTLKELCLNADEQPEAGSSSQAPNIEWITRLTSLETLELSLPDVTNLPGNFSALTQLRDLSLSYMKELDLTQLPSSSSLWTLRLKHCTIQEPNFSSLKYLSKLELEDCDLAEIGGLADLKLLEVLKISRCSITNLNGLKDLRRLRKVQVFSCDLANLSELHECECEVDISSPQQDISF